MCLCEKNRDAGDGKQSIPPNVSLRNAIQEIRRAWPALSRRSPHYASIVWTTEGPKLGAGTLLARSVSGEEARILALLSVAFDCVVPSSALERLKRAEAKFTSGDIVMSAIHVALTKLPPLVRREDGYRLTWRHRSSIQAFSPRRSSSRRANSTLALSRTSRNIIPINLAFRRAMPAEGNGPMGTISGSFRRRLIVSQRASVQSQLRQRSLCLKDANRNGNGRWIIVLICSRNRIRRGA